MTGSPFFGRLTTDRREAFPDLVSLELKVTQDPFGMHAHPPGKCSATFGETDFPKHVACVNRRCEQGGLDLENIIKFSKAGFRRYPCTGHEGTPKGRKRGDNCDNQFDVELKIIRSMS